MDLQEKVNMVKRQGGERELEQVLLSCINEGHDEGLNAVLQLLSFKPEATFLKLPFKYATALATLYWGIKGISSLADAALNSESISIIATILETLSHAAASSLDSMAESRLRMIGFYNLRERLDFTNVKYHSEDFVLAAKDELMNVAINCGTDFSAPNIIALSIQLVTLGDTSSTEKAFNCLFAASSSRWLRIDRKGLNDFINIIQKPDVAEQEVHNHIARNPYLLDPFYAHVWSKAPLGEELEADFIIRLMDDNYIVVEIERPSDPIMNKAGDFSARTTHAIRQAIEYRSWIVENYLYAKQRFENLRTPSCLVVIGLESKLSEKQKKLLQQHNERSHGLKVVGFDWLYQRANIILVNLVKHGFERFEI